MPLKQFEDWVRNGVMFDRSMSEISVSTSVGDARSYVRNRGQVWDVTQQRNKDEKLVMVVFRLDSSLVKIDVHHPRIGSVGFVQSRIPPEALTHAIVYNPAFPETGPTYELLDLSALR
jgi:hypothetical protein